MISIKVNDTLYPAAVSGKFNDKDWDNRSSKSITLEMDYGTANALFVDGLAWSIVMETEDGIEEYDNSDYCVSGSITDHRDGTMTIKMGKLTELEEAYEILLGGI